MENGPIPNNETLKEELSRVIMLMGKADPWKDEADIEDSDDPQCFIYNCHIW